MSIFPTKAVTADSSYTRVFKSDTVPPDLKNPYETVNINGFVPPTSSLCLISIEGIIML